MTLTMAQVTIDCKDAARLATFYAQVLDLPVDPDANEYYATVGRTGADRLPTALMFLQVPEERVGKNRVHVDFTSDSWQDVDRPRRRRGRHPSRRLRRVRHTLDDADRSRGQRLRHRRRPLSDARQEKAAVTGANRCELLGSGEVGERDEDGRDAAVGEQPVAADLVGDGAGVVLPGVRRCRASGRAAARPAPPPRRGPSDDRHVQHGDRDVGGIAPDVATVLAEHRRACGRACRGRSARCMPSPSSAAIRRVRCSPPPPTMIGTSETGRG